MNYQQIFLNIQPKNYLDIGAFDGSISWLIKKKFPDCDIMMVEANPYCEEKLKSLKIPYQIIGLSKEQGKQNFYIETNNKICTGASYLKENTVWYNEGNYEIVEIDIDTLDNRDYFSEQIIDLVKLDTQGSELDILIGGRKTIKRSKFVLIEVSTIEYNQGAPLMDEIVNLMRKYEFKIEEIINFDKFETNQICQMDILFKNLYL